MSRSNKQIQPQKVALSADPFCSEYHQNSSALDPFITYNALRLNGCSVMPYGQDNNFPSNVSDAIVKSATANRCISVASSFILGEGVSYDGLSKPNLQESWSSIFRFAVHDFIKFNQFALRFCSNLSGENYTFKYIPFEQLRISPDNNIVSITLDWTKHQQVITYPIYNGGTIDQGVEYVLIFKDLNPNELFYSYRASSLAKDCISESSIQQYYKGNLSKGFQPQVMLSLPFTPDNFKDFSNKLKQSYCGVDNADKLMIVAGDGEQAPTFSAIPTVDLDKYQNIYRDVRESIVRWFGIPKSLIGLDATSGFSNKAEQLIAECAAYEKFIAGPARQFILESFNALHEGFNTPLFSIEPMNLREIFETGESEATSEAQTNNNDETINPNIF